MVIQIIPKLKFSTEKAGHIRRHTFARNNGRIPSLLMMEVRVRESDSDSTSLILPDECLYPPPLMIRTKVILWNIIKSDVENIQEV